jgi:hypothetical protein
MSDQPPSKSGSNLVSIALGVGLILLGVLFLIGRSLGFLFDFDIGHYAWPFFIIVPGLLLFLAAFALERRAGVTLAILGGMAMMTGAILLVQNTFDLYATWAYAWALVAPTSIGLALLLYGSLRGMGEEARRGLNMTGIGLAIFVLAGLFFELGIGLSGFRVAAGSLCWPLLLIGLGVVLLLSNMFWRRRKPTS